MTRLRRPLSLFVIVGAMVVATVLSLQTTQAAHASSTTTQHALSTEATLITREPAAASSTFSTPIQHVVFIFQENHSFDNVLGLLCVQQNRCDGATSGKLFGGQTIPLGQATDKVPQVDHAIGAQRTALDNGAMDGFSQIQGCTVTDNYRCYTQFAPSQIPNVTSLAQNFALSDRTFEENLVPSFGAHLDVVAATLDGFSGNIPVTGTAPEGNGWGCDSNEVTNWTSPSGQKFSNTYSCIPDQNGNTPHGATPVQYVPTIMDRLDAAGLTWNLYTGVPGSENTTGYGWAICPSFWECLGSSQSTHMVPNTQFVTDAQNGTLPNFSIVTPSQTNSQHNGDSMTVGDNWIGQDVSATMNGPDWASTAIFITSDDCGCFYDHVPPPAGSGYGFRVPMVIVSPYARAGYTDSNNATFASVLAYTESVFGLAPLNNNDGSAYNFANAFNYSQPPLAPVRMVTHSISAAEQRQLKVNPPDPTDPS